ncbi:MAG: cell division protein ZapE, partial [Rhodobiaceae bacterium]|nr:cell division protein ZapE [Rhodobiaceae bacterium]
MTMGPLQAYRALVAQGVLSSDLEQERAARHLGRLYDELCHWAPGKKSGPLGFLGVGRMAPVPQGIYLWGDVGRGKSMLMDMFFDVVPTDK